MRRVVFEFCVLMFISGFPWVVEFVWWFLVLCGVL